MPGIGIAARMRNTMRAPSTKSTRFRSVSSSMMRRVLRTNASHILFDSTSCLFYRSARGRRDRNALNGKLLRELAPSYYLDRARLAAERPPPPDARGGGDRPP